MPTGIIKTLKDRFGFIARKGQDDLHFSSSQLLNARIYELKSGDPVEFDEGIGKDGRPTATKVKLLRQTGSSGSDDKIRFRNPYNFVRFLGAGKDVDAQTAQLGRLPAPSHASFSGLSGTIKCTFKTITPLFIAHKIHESQDGHKELEMFEVNGSPRIPASTLRGMVRSVYESITNSCLEMVENRRHSKHYEAKEAYKFVPARIVKSESGWELHPLPGATNRNEDNLSKLQYAAWVRMYAPLKPKTVSRPFVNLNGFKHGDGCWGVMAAKAIPHWDNKFSFFNIEALESGELSKAAVEAKYPGKRIEKGWLCLTNQNTEIKHDERFFFRARGNDYLPEVIKLSDKVRQSYKELIQDYQKRHADEVKERRKNGPLPEEVDRTKKIPALSRFIPDSEPAELQDGDLVYVEIDPQNHIKFIVPVSIPRILYEKRIGDLISAQDAHLLPCSQLAVKDEETGMTLCPACRLFGWVADRKLPEGKQNSFAGRLQFSDGRFQPEVTWCQESMTLAILGSPKPTTTSFYLLDREKEPNFPVDYDADGARLRGRKYYWHHGLKKFSAKTGNGLREWERPEHKKDRQNVTIKKAIAENNTFVFQIRFENLDEIELGALLWSLSLEQGWHHRLGLAKPLGFGSIINTSVELRLLDRQKRYQELGERAETKLGSDDWQPRYVEPFKDALKKRHGRPFSELANYEDLEALLANKSDLPIHYPRPTVNAEPAGEQFKWFVENKRNRHQALPLAPDDEGLGIFG